MTTLVIGTSHRVVSPAVLERFALTTPDVAALLDRLAARSSIAESAVLATCNRVEIYAESAHPESAVTDALETLAATTGTAADELRTLVYVHRDTHAVGHLVRVSAGLDSMALGDAQVRGQIRAAYTLAQQHGTVGPVLHGLFQHALRAGKRVENETRIGRSASSMVAVALAAAEEETGPLMGRRALVIGAGVISALGAAALRRAGVDELTVVNRSPDAARRLADRYGGRCAGLDALPDLLHRTDLVVSATGSREPVVTRALAAPALAGRTGAPLVLVDLALPRDIEQGLAAEPGAHLIDLAALETRLKESAAQVPVDDAHRIAAEETAAYVDGLRRDGVAPLIVAMRSTALSIAEAEVGRLLGREPALAGAVRGEVERTARRIAEKLMHRPTVRVREMAARSDGALYVRVVHDLFGPSMEQEPDATDPSAAPDGPAPDTGGEGS